MCLQFVLLAVIRYIHIIFRETNLLLGCVYGTYRNLQDRRLEVICSFGLLSDLEVFLCCLPGSLGFLFAVIFGKSA
jgi:hypothetical protein